MPELNKQALETAINSFKKHPRTEGQMNRFKEGVETSIKAYLDALPEQEVTEEMVECVKIKPLNWVKATGPVRIAVTPVGQFAVWDDEDPRWAFSRRGGYTYTKVSDVAHAKTEATAYYRRLVLSMLDHDSAKAVLFPLPNTHEEDK